MANVFKNKTVIEEERLHLLIENLALAHAAERVHSNNIGHRYGLNYGKDGNCNVNIN
jgi:hypothetical protein